MPLPLAAQQRIGQVMQMLPALPLAIKAPPRRDQMQMGMVMTIASMRVDHRAVAPLKRFAPDLAREIIHALDATAHQRAQQDRSVVVEGRAEHGWDRQD